MRTGKRLNIASLNAHLICVICSGYYVEATTIVECLHTFCRSCIVGYLKTSKFCPICDVQIHDSKPWSSLRPDKTLQDLVYKLVPGLYQDEMRRRRQFYTGLGEDETASADGEEKGFLPHGARFFAQDDSISLSLEYYTGFIRGAHTQPTSHIYHRLRVRELRFQMLHPAGEPVYLALVLSQCETEGDEKMNHVEDKPKRYLQCPAAVTVRHLKKFLQMKYGIGVESWVDIIYNDECLPNYFSLIDVAYTFAWRRTSPMRLSYRIYTKKTVKNVKTGNKYKTASKVEDERKSAGKHTSSLEQQRQSEYLGNFNLNPTKSGFCRNQNNNTNVANNNLYSEIKSKSYKDDLQIDDGSGDKMFSSFPTSEDSNASGLRIISEKEESLKGNSDESLDSITVEKRKECNVHTFSEEAEDGFAAKKLLKNKHKSDCKKEKKKHDGEKRKRSASHAEGTEEKKGGLDGKKRRKSMLEGVKEAKEEEEKSSRFVIRDRPEEEEPLANLKNEALRKVFVLKEKPEACVKVKEEEVKRKKRKKSKHHEGEPKKKKMSDLTSPSILSFAKDPLKLKVKLTPAIIKASEEEEAAESKKSEEWEREKSSRTESTKEKEDETKKTMSDKERLLHLRAVRHKNIIKTNSQNYISAPRSLTISKVDASEQTLTKPRMVESRPSLEIMLIPPSDSSKSKNSESNQEKKPESKAVMDNFGVLDLSEKSTRTKVGTSTSPKDNAEGAERTKKSAQQSIMQIAQTLVNRKLSPMLPDKRFDSVSDPTTAAAAMRNLKTLSDTAVNILMAAQSKGFPASPESPKRNYPTVSNSPPQKSLTLPNPTKDCENGTGLKIPMFPVSRERPNPIPPVPNLHEIYPKSRGRPPGSLSRMTPTPIKPGQNQTVRQIPNPSALLNRQNNQLLNRLPVPIPKLPENGDLSKSNNNKLSSIPPLQSIKSKMAVPGSTDEIPEKLLVPKLTNNNLKSVQNGSDNGFVKNGDDGKKLTGKVTGNNANAVRRLETMARNIESVAAGLTARAVSNAMVDAK